MQQHLTLPLGRCAAMAAHGRNNERRGSQCAQLADEGGHDLGQPADAAAPHAHGNALPGPHHGPGARAFHLLANGRADVPQGCGRRDIITHARHLGHGNGIQKLMQDGLRNVKLDAHEHSLSGGQDPTSASWLRRGIQVTTGGCMPVCISIMA